MKCDHGYDRPEGGGPPRSCMTCMEDEGVGATPVPPPAPVTVVSRTFTAEYGGTCSWCGFSFTPGASIVRMSDDTHRHTTCTNTDRGDDGYGR